MVEAEGRPVGLGSVVSWRTERPACARCSHHCQDSELQLGLHLSTPGLAAPWASEKPGEAHGPGDTQSPAPHPLRYPVLALRGTCPVIQPGGCRGGA